MEDWVEIEEFPQYSVSDLGRVRIDRFDRIVQPRQNQYGGVFVGLMHHGVQHSRSLALLVATYFIQPDGPNFNTPINLDGDRWNCRADNIVWRPRWFARKYNHQFKERYSRGIDDAVRCVDTDERFPSTLDAAVRYGLLEADVVASMDYMTYVWPTYQSFELAY